MYIPSLVGKPFHSWLYLCLLFLVSSYSLHLTTFCLQYRPTVVACVCIHLACKWSNWEIPVSTDGKHWWEYVDRTVTLQLLDGESFCRCFAVKLYIIYISYINKINTYMFKLEVWWTLCAFIFKTQSLTAVSLKQMSHPWSLAKFYQKYASERSQECEADNQRHCPLLCFQSSRMSSFRSWRRHPADWRG